MEYSCKHFLFKTISRKAQDQFTESENVRKNRNLRYQSSYRIY